MTLGQYNYICCANVCPAVAYRLGGRGYTACHVTELGRRFPNVGIDGCKHVYTNGWYTLVGQPVANEQKDVGPTLAANVGPTHLHYVGPTYNQRRMTALGRRLPDVGINGCKLRLDRRRPNVVTNGWYTLVGQPVANEQKDVGPTLAANVGPTQLRTLGQRTANGCMLSGLVVPGGHPSNSWTGPGAA